VDGTQGTESKSVYHHPCIESNSNFSVLAPSRSEEIMLENDMSIVISTEPWPDFS